MSINEEFKPCRDFPTYSVSDTGRVRNIKGKFLSLNKTSMGYPRCSLCINGKVHQVHIHRLVAMEFCEGFSPDKQVNHIDGDKKNNSASNLEWISHKENANHAVRMGLKIHPNKLDDIQALTIITLKNKLSKKDLAAIFSVSTSTIINIIKRKQYIHLGAF